MCLRAGREVRAPATYNGLRDEILYWIDHHVCNPMDRDHFLHPRIARKQNNQLLLENLAKHRPEARGQGSSSKSYRRCLSLNFANGPLLKLLLAPLWHIFKGKLMPDLVSLSSQAGMLRYESILVMLLPAVSLISCCCMISPTHVIPSPKVISKR